MAEDSSLNRDWISLVFAVVASIAGFVILLVPAVVMLLLAFSGDHRLPPTPFVLTVILLLCVVVAEWPWRSLRFRAGAATLRFAALGFTLVWLFWSLRSAAWFRWAFDPANKVTSADGRQIVREFESGVLTLYQFVEQGLTEALLPISVLLWFASLPGVIGLFEVVAKTSRKR